MEDLDFTNSIIDNCPWAACIIHVDLNEEGEPIDLTFVYANKLMAEIEGVPLNKLLNRRYFQIYPNGDKKWLQPCFEAAYKNKNIEKDDIAFSSELFLHISIISTNKEGYCFCVLRDIKDETLQKLEYQKKLEKALISAEKEKNYLNSLCFDYTNLYSVDFKTGEFEILKNWSKSNVAILHKETKHFYYEDLYKNYCEAYVVEKDKEYFLTALNIDNIKERLSKQEGYSFNYEVIPNKDGKRYFEARIIRNSNEDEIDGCLLAFRYIDDIVIKEKKTQEKIQKALDEVNLSNEIISAISKVYISIYRIDLIKDHYEEISSSGDMHYLTGVSGVASAKLKEICEKFAKEEYKEEVLKFFDLGTLKDRLMNEENIGIEFKTVDDSWLLSRFIVKKRDENNVPTNVLYVTRNISNQKRKEEYLAVEIENQRRANEAKSDFLSIVSHDIRTPINAISGYSELGIKQACDENSISNFKKIKSASNYLTSIVNNVLDSNSIERGVLTLQNENISIKDLTNDINKIISSVVIKSSKQKRSVNVHDILHDEINVDSVKLKQIIFNLFNNACIYTPEDGSVMVDVYQRDYKDDNVMLCIEVKDTGIGMSNEFQLLMFEKYSREVDTRISQTRGLGIGLNIVKKYVELLNGTISVDSKKGEGTTFRVELPVKCVDDVDNECVVNIVNSDRILNILIAEDNDLNYEILAGLIMANKGINFKDIKITRAKNGNECLDILDKSVDYDCIMMDVHMPIMDGLMATCNIRERGIDIPIIAVTANAFEKDKLECIKAGMNDYLSKPIDSNKLISVLKNL